MLDYDILKDLKLDKDQSEILKNTMSSNSFYYLLANHIVNNIPMSVVRMGDGEKIILDNKHSGKEFKDLVTEDWIPRMGYKDCSIENAADLIIEAIKECTYFAPNLNGVIDSSFSLYNFNIKHKSFIDNFFVNSFTKSQINVLYKLAKKILIINNNDDIKQYAINKYSNEDYQFEFLKLANWTELRSIEFLASISKANLVLISGNKCLGPRLAKYGKISVDVGNTIDKWLEC